MTRWGVGVDSVGGAGSRLRGLDAGWIEAADGGPRLDAWERWRRAQPDPRFDQAVSLITRDRPEPEARLAVAVVHRDDEVVAGVPVSFAPWTQVWKARLPGRTHPLASFSFDSATVVGPPIGPPDGDGQRLLLSEVLAAAEATDVVRFPLVEVGSPTDGLLGEPRIRRGWWLLRGEPEPWMRIRMAKDFDTYLERQMRAKPRYNLRRTVRRLHEVPGGVDLEVVTDPADVESLCRDCEAVWRRSWHTAAGAGPILTSRAAVARTAWMAEQGWLRAYLLRARADGTPVAFVTGYLVDRVFWTHKVAYDEAWARHGPGTALWVELIADLHERSVADSLEFGPGDFPYKRLLANEEAVMRSVTLIRRSPRVALACLPPVAYQRARGRAVEGLARLGLDRQLQRWSRRVLGR